MIQQILGPVLQQAGKALAKGAASLGKAIAKHIAENWPKYAVGAGTAAATGTAYAVGKKRGHTKGKEEGTAEQAKRDEEKMEKMHRKHEQDRKRWNNQRKKYEDLLDDIENQ